MVGHADSISPGRCFIAGIDAIGGHPSQNLAGCQCREPKGLAHTHSRTKTKKQQLRLSEFGDSLLPSSASHDCSVLHRHRTYGGQASASASFCASRALRSSYASSSWQGPELQLTSKGESSAFSAASACRFCSCRCPKTHGCRLQCGGPGLLRSPRGFQSGLCLHHLSCTNAQASAVIALEANKNHEVVAIAFSSFSFAVASSSSSS